MRFNGVSMSRQLLWRRSRSGVEVPVVRAGQAEVGLHSLYDPEREAQRMAEAIAEGSTVLCLGLGAGLHLPALLRRARAVIVIEWDAELAKLALSEKAVGARSAGADLLVAPDPAILADAIAARYIAAIHMPLEVVSLRGRASIDPDGERAVRATVAAAIELLKDDLAVQARMGRTWLRNTLYNLATLRQAAARPSFRGRPVVVTAAGPSLDANLPALRRHRRSFALIATDTSAGPLAAASVIPDLVVTIDCQQASIHHVIPAGVRALPFLIDIAAPPSMTAALLNTRFFLSGHPLSQALSGCGLNLPRLDTSAGNVTQVAVEAGLACGAEEVIVLGADFAYPRGRAYASESYIHRLFRAGEHRLSPSASRHFSFLADRPGLYRSSDGDQIASYGQRLLDGYRDRLEEFAGNRPVRLCTELPAIPATRFHEGGSAGLWRGLPAKEADPARILHAISWLTKCVTAVRPAIVEDSLDEPSADRTALAVLTPMLTWMRARDTDMPAQELVRTARKQTLGILSRARSLLESEADTDVADH